jgi:hypothetical protein
MIKMNYHYPVPGKEGGQYFIWFEEVQGKVASKRIFQLSCV